MIALAGCMLTSKTEVIINQTHHPLGLKPLPRSFLNWWFSQVPKFNAKADKVDNKKPLTLIGKNADIINTQRLLTSPVVATIPSNFDLRDYGDITPVKNQSSNGTCWAFSTVGSLESALLVQLGPTGIESKYPFIFNSSSPDLSEQFVAYNDTDWQLLANNRIAWQESNKDIGGYQFFSFYNLIRRGVPLESDFPYITSSQPWIKWNPQDNVWTNHLIKPAMTLVIPSFDQFRNYASYINTIKSALEKYGALSVDIEVHSGFGVPQGQPSQGWTYVGPKEVSNKVNHAVLLIGWDSDWKYNGVDYGPVWILKNSWGTGWGDQGYWRQPMITQSQFDNHSVYDWQVENSYMWVPYFNK